MKASTASWKERLYQDLKDPKFAKRYIAACLEEGVPLPMALSDVIRAQGVGKVAKKAHIARPNVLRAIRPSANPTFETMKRLLHSIGLDFSVRSAA